MTPDEFVKCFELALDSPSVRDKLSDALSDKITDKLTANLSQEIQSLRLELASRNTKINELDADVKKLKPLENEVTVLKGSLAKQKETIEALQTQVNDLQKLDDEKEQYMRRNTHL